MYTFIQSNILLVVRVVVARARIEPVRVARAQQPAEERVDGPGEGVPVLFVWFVGRCCGCCTFMDVSRWVEWTEQSILPAVDLRGEKEPHTEAGVHCFGV